MGTEFNEEVKSDGTGSSEAVNKYKEAIKTVEGLKAFLLLGMLMMWPGTTRCSVISL